MENVAQLSFISTNANLQHTTQEDLRTYNFDFFIVSFFFGLSTLSTGTTPEELVEVGMPVEGGVCPGAAPVVVDNPRDFFR